MATAPMKSGRATAGMTPSARSAPLIGLLRMRATIGLIARHPGIEKNASTITIIPTKPTLVATGFGRRANDWTIGLPGPPKAMPAAAERVPQARRWMVATHPAGD